MSSALSPDAAATRAFCCSCFSGFDSAALYALMFSPVFRVSAYGAAAPFFCAHATP